MEILLYTTGIVLLLLLQKHYSDRDTTKKILKKCDDKINNLKFLYKKYKQYLIRETKTVIKLQKDLEQEKRSNAANNGWNTKYRETIEELEQKNQDQADTIKRLMINKEEVHVLLEKLLVSKKKEQKELVNNFTFNEHDEKPTRKNK